MPPGSAGARNPVGRPARCAAAAPGAPSGASASATRSGRRGQGKSETEDAQNAIRFHEYFVSEYQKALNKSLIPGDRSFCTKIKKKI